MAQKRQVISRRELYTNVHPSYGDFYVYPLSSISPHNKRPYARKNFYGEPVRYCPPSMLDKRFNLSPAGVGDLEIESGKITPCAHDPFTAFYYLPPPIPQ